VLNLQGLLQYAYHLVAFPVQQPLSIQTIRFRLSEIAQIFNFTSFISSFVKLLQGQRAIDTWQISKETVKVAYQIFFIFAQFIIYYYYFFFLE